MIQKYITATNSQFGMSSDAVSASGNSEQKVEEPAEPPTKRPKLLANYTNNATSQLPGSSMHQINKYLTTECNYDDSLLFWHTNRAEFDKLYISALRALSVPASSSAVERVFSQGGIILRPHRARMSDKLLSELIFLKCNK